MLVHFFLSLVIMSTKFMLYYLNFSKKKILFIHFFQVDFYRVEGHKTILMCWINSTRKGAGTGMMMHGTRD